MQPLPKTYIEERPWGSFETFSQNSPVTVKILTVHPHEAFSLQYHTERDEFWRVISGDGEVTIGDDSRIARAGDTFFVPRGTVHRITGGSEDIVVLEVSTGVFREEDIIRLEDRYGRVDGAPAHSPA